MKARPGFTIVEVLLAMAIFAIIAGFTTINLLKPQTKASIEGITTTLVSDLRAQQLKAMAGDSEGQGSSAQYFGIYFESNRYTLFRGSPYGSDPAVNFIVNLDPSITLTYTLPPPGNQIVFVKRSGEFQGYASGPYTIILTNAQSGEQKILTINRYGAITVN